ncbi:RNA-guided endonuclease InsQ/TnpB family protein [Nocardia sp. NPDC058480]|uniref:RNA-guided endonuclease InsQ/TnpB family protein n=1 Tax=Nocardia sp. NPDC058480 TaxID=3346522 RepID=UPI00364CC8F2
MRALESEWHRCRFLWNEAVHQQRGEEKPTFARLSKMLTEARARTAWLRAGSQVAQQQMLRTYSRALDHSFTVKGRGRPTVKRRRTSLPSLEYTTRGFGIAHRMLALPKGVTIPVVWSRELPSEPSSVRVYQDSLGHWYAAFVVRREVEPAPAATGSIGIDWGVSTTATATSPAHDLPYAGHRRRCAAELARAQRKMTCASCGARAKQRLALQVRIFSCDTCGHTADRDRNAATVILAAAVELDRASAEDIRHCGPPSGAVNGAVRVGNPPASAVGKG